MAGSAVEARGSSSASARRSPSAGLTSPSRGLRVRLLGPNGAGKTTMVAGSRHAARADSGTASVFGRDVVGEASQVREVIALTGQFAAIDELLTGRENLRMFGQLFRLDRREASRRATTCSSSSTWRTPVTGSPDLFGGMRRRLDLASSLLTRPGCSSSTSRRPASTHAACNQIWDAIRDLVREGRPCSSPRSTSRRRISSPTGSR